MSGKRHPSMTAQGHAVCECGHYDTGHAPRLEGQVGVDSHGACMACDCQRFTFKEFSRHPRAARSSGLTTNVFDFEHAVRRMLQALDAYWLGYEGLPKGRYPRGQYTQEDWWNRYERYRAEAEAARTHR